MNKYAKKVESPVVVKALLQSGPCNLMTKAPGSKKKGIAKKSR